MVWPLRQAGNDADAYAVETCSVVHATPTTHAAPAIATAPAFPSAPTSPTSERRLTNILIRPDAAITN